MQRKPLSPEENKKWKRRIRYVFSTRFLTSCAPRTQVASYFKIELNAIGIPEEDHLLFVMNRFPDKLANKQINCN